MNPFQILLVEDDTDLREAISVTLRLGGVDHVAFECAEDALPAIDPEVEQMLVTDFRLPGMNGLDFARQLKSDPQTKSIPIIMLTARDSVDDKLAGFQAGADDYLVKPFSLPELHARVEAVLRRGQTGLQNMLEIGDLSYDMNSLTVARQGKTIKLSPIGLKLLEKLMKSSPHVVRRETLEELLWGESLPGSDSLRSHIHTLRQAIDKPFSSPLLHTVHGIGFCLKVQTNEI